MAAESEVSFDELDGSALQIGVLRTRWNDEHVSNLVDGIKVNNFLSSLCVSSKYVVSSYTNNASHRISLL